MTVEAHTQRKQINKIQNLTLIRPSMGLVDMRGAPIPLKSQNENREQKKREQKNKK